MRWGKRRADRSIDRREATSLDQLSDQILSDQSRSRFTPRPAGAEAPRDVFLAVADELSEPLAAAGWTYARSGPHLTKQAGTTTVKLRFLSGNLNVAGEIVLLWVTAIATDRAHRVWRRTIGLPDDGPQVVDLNLGTMLTPPGWLEWNLAQPATRPATVRDIASTIESFGLPLADILLDVLPHPQPDPDALAPYVTLGTRLELLVRAGRRDEAAVLIEERIIADEQYAKTYVPTLAALRRGTRDGLLAGSPPAVAAWLVALADLPVR